MKKVIAILCSAALTLMMFVSIVPTTLFAAEGDVAIDETNFPDAIFRTYVSDNFDKSTPKDNVLSKEEIAAAIEINVSSKSLLIDLKGIEYFTALKELYCSYTGITQLDVSKNTALQYLYCYETGITQLDVSKNTALQDLRCDITGITQLDVSKNEALQFLECSNTRITELDVSKNTELIHLYCNNTSIKQLNVSKNTVLKTLFCNDTEITELDLNNNTVLEALICIDTKITKLNISKKTALKELYCNNSKLSTLILTDGQKANVQGFNFEGQTIFAYSRRVDGKYTVDMKTVVGAENLDKVSITDTEDYTYNAETGIVTFLKDIPTTFTYLFDTGVPAAHFTRAVSETVKMDVTATVCADYTEIENLLVNFDELNKDDYINYDEVNQGIDDILKTIDSVVPATEQATVDGYLQAIQAEIDKLVKKPAPTPSPETTTNENMMYVVLAGILILSGGTLIYKKRKEN